MIYERPLIIATFRRGCSILVATPYKFKLKVVPILRCPTQGTRGASNSLIWGGGGGEWDDFGFLKTELSIVSIAIFLESL